MSSVWIIITSTAGFSLSAFLLAKRLRLFAGYCDTVSLPDAVAARYGSESTRGLTALAILLGVIGYLATQMLAMALVLQSVLQGALEMDFSVATCLAISCAVLTFYSVTGGIIASVYTDIIQGAVMVVAGVLICFTAASSVEGGISQIVSTVMEDDAEAMGPWGTMGIFACLAWYFTFVIGGAGQPHIITKHMMIRNVTDAPKILPISMAGYLFGALLWISVGLAMRALVLIGDAPELHEADAAAPAFLLSFAHPLLAGIVFAGLFAAIMSTADAFLNIGTAAAVHDMPRALGVPTFRRELLWSRVGTVVIALMAALFALFAHGQGQLVALLGAFGWGTFAGALVPTVAIGFNWKRATPLAANVAIVSSLVVNVSLQIGDVSVPYAIPGYAISLLLSIALFLGISLASRPPHIDPDIEKLMDI